MSKKSKAAAKPTIIWQEHVKLICAAWQKGVESIIETGERLNRAKADPDLPKRSFEAMVQTKLPFGPRTARYLMAIANHPVISNRKHASALPPSWMTLYELSKLPQSLLIEKIEDGVITAKMERKDVAALKKPEQRDNDPPPTDDEPDTTPADDEPDTTPTEPHNERDSPLAAAWKKANRREKSEFVHAYWNEVMQVRTQHDAEETDRWIETDTLKKRRAS
jgi:hypothetical protein